MINFVYSTAPSMKYEICIKQSSKFKAYVTDLYKFQVA